jgi:fimbrial chaperone protein
MKTKIEAVLIAALVLVSMAMAAPAMAQQAMMDVAPTTIDLASRESGLFYVTNHGKTPVHVQVEGMDWSQIDGADKLTPSDALFVSPPVTEIAPGARQTIRLMASPKPGASEAAYRLLVTQLPEGAGDAGSVKVLLQFSVPVFVGLHSKQAPQLSWEASRDGADMNLTVRNDGGNTAKCVNVALTSNGKAVSFDPGAVFYVLPHGMRRFRIASVEAGTPLHLAGRDQRSGRDFSADISLHQ